jgi:hypothetical protein
MLRTIRKLFGKSEAPGTAPSWLRELGETSIFVRENNQKGYGLFTHLSNGQRRLPFFTDNDHAQKSCGGAEVVGMIMPALCQSSGAYALG